MAERPTSLASENRRGGAESQPRIGIALGAGGAKGVAHIAMLEALDELGITPHRIAGSSIGAVIGALYASGLSAKEIKEKVAHLAITKGDTPAHREVARLRRIRLTLKKFARGADAAGFRITRRKYYLTRPTHKLRYGVPVVGASLLGRVPLLNEILVTACYCLLDVKKPGA